MQLTRTSNKLKRTILFNAERGGTPYFRPAAHGIFFPDPDQASYGLYHD